MLFFFFLLPYNIHATTSTADCLTTLYQLDDQIVEKIVDRLSPLLNDPAKESLLEEFIALSKTISLKSESKATSPIKEDACLKAPKSHPIIFENDCLRILDISTQPEETIPFHTHQWDDITIVTQGSLFESLGLKNSQPYPLNSSSNPVKCVKLGIIHLEKISRQIIQINKNLPKQP